MEYYIPIIIAIVGALGLREVMPIVVKWFFNRPQSSLELEGVALTNTDKKLKSLQEVIALSEELSEKFQGQLEIIASLKEDKILDKQKIDHRDGVVEYQKKELSSLHGEIITLRANESRSLERIMQLESRVSELEKQNKELIGLKEVNSVLADQNMTAKAILKKLQEDGVWTGDTASVFSNA
jgi:hypothetical protein